MQRLSLTETSWATPISRWLASYVALTAADIAFVENALTDMRTFPASTDLRFEDVAGIPQPLAVVSGWAAGSAFMADGRRQIVSLFMPGDIIDPSDLRATGLTSAALTTTKTLEAAALFRSRDDKTGARIAEALRAYGRAVQVRRVRHIVRLGRLSAYERTADLILELHDRQQRAGLADQRIISLPLTQEALSDHLGLSVVHVNRTLQQLRREGLIDYQGGRLILRDRARLSAAAGLLGEAYGGAALSGSA